MSRKQPLTEQQKRRRYRSSGWRPLLRTLLDREWQARLEREEKQLTCPACGRRLQESTIGGGIFHSATGLIACGSWEDAGLGRQPYSPPEKNPK